LKKLSASVTRRKASVGIANDGDADRIGVVDENGVFLTQLQVFALLALYMLDVRKERGAIVKTITTTSMLDRLGAIYKIPIFETKVGFKYVAPVMIKENALMVVRKAVVTDSADMSGTGWDSSRTLLP